MSYFWSCDPLPVLLDDEGSGEEESGSGCDSPSCETDPDIYFSTPADPSKPRVVPLGGAGTSGASSHRGGAGAVAAVALCCLGLLAQHLR